MSNKKTILITGASSGLGMGMAREFAQRGYNLALCARTVSKLETIQAELLQAQPDIQVSIKALDVDDHESVFTVFRAFQQEFGQIDRVLVNAGIGKGGPIGTGLFWANKQTAITNFVSALAQCEAAMEIFREQNAGHLVVISSVSAYRGMRGNITTYAATKAAVATLADGIRMEMMGKPIKVSTIYPGYIKTPINEDIDNAPFRVDLKTGCEKMVNAIEAEVEEASVPGWPWKPVGWAMRNLPLSVVRKLT